MFQIILFYLFLITSIQTTTKPTLKTDNINTNLLVNHYDCRERLNLRRFSLNRVDNCHISQSNIETSPATVEIYIRAKALDISAHKCTLTYTRQRKICGYDSDTNHYYDRDSFYSNQMARHHIVDQHECKNLILHIKNPTNTTKPPSISLLPDRHLQDRLEKTFGSISTSKFDTETLGTLVWSPKYTSWIPTPSNNRYSRCKKQNDEIVFELLNWKLTVITVTTINLQYDHKKIHHTIKVINYHVTITMAFALLRQLSLLPLLGSQKNIALFFIPTHLMAK